MRKAPFYLLLISLTLSTLIQAESEPSSPTAPVASSASELEELKAQLAHNQLQLNTLQSRLEHEQAENSRQQLAYRELQTQLQQARSDQQWISNEQRWFALGVITVLFSILLGRLSKPKRRAGVEWVN